MRLQFGGSDPAGGPVTVEFEVVQGQVRCWAGDAVVLLDQESLACWLTAPHRTLTRGGVTFEPASWGVMFSFAGRVQRTVIRPPDVAELITAAGGDYVLTVKGNRPRRRPLTSARVDSASRRTWIRAQWYCRLPWHRSALQTG